MKQAARTLQRHDPLGICAATPNASLGSGDSARTEVKGSTELLNTDHCVVCGKLMQPILASDIPAYICWEHRVVLPQPDADAMLTRRPESAPAPTLAPTSVFSVRSGLDAAEPSAGAK
jgi:hypothetical protein